MMPLPEKCCAVLLAYSKEQLYIMYTESGNEDTSYVSMRTAVILTIKSIVPVSGRVKRNVLRLNQKSDRFAALSQVGESVVWYDTQ
jgi:hypothetical protein